MGPVRGVISADTHNSPISGHHDYLAEMHKKAPIGTGPLFNYFVLHSSAILFLSSHPQCSQNTCTVQTVFVHACVCLNLRLYSKTASFSDHISHSELLVFCALLFHYT